MRHFALIAMLGGALAVAGSSAVAQQKTSPFRLGLGCTLHSTTATVTNGQSAPIPAGTKVTVEYTKKVIGDWGLPRYVAASAERTLSSPLFPGHSMQMALTSPSAPFCVASFDAGPPDLVITRVTKGATLVQVEVRNKNGFFDANASLTQLRYMKCPQVVQLSVVLPLPLMPKGSTRIQEFHRAVPPGNQYIDVFADSTNVVFEANEANNVYTEVSTCIH